MAKQTINIGAAPNDGTGTPLRTSFDYTNQNFTELYTAVAPSGNNIAIPGSATVGTTLGVTGASTFTGAVVCNGAVTLGDALGDAINVTGSLTAYNGQNPSSIRASASDYAAVAFDGTTSGTRVTSTLTGQNIGTGDFSLWSRFRVPALTAFVSNPATIALGPTNTDSSGNNSCRLVLLSGGSLSFRINDGAGATTSGDIANFSTGYSGQVVDVVVTRTGATLKIYINGTDTAYTGTPAASTSINSIYCQTGIGIGVALFIGRIYRSVVFNRALSASDVTELITTGVNPSDQWGTQTAIYTSDFSTASTDGFTGIACTVASNIDSIGGQDNNLRTTIDGTTGFHLFARASTLPRAKTVRVVADFYRPASNTVVTGVNAQHYNQVATATTTQLVADTWTTITQDVRDLAASGSNSAVAWYLVNATGSITVVGNSTDVVYVRNIQVTRIGAIVDLDFTVGTGYQTYDRSTNNLHGTMFGGVEFMMPRRSAVLYATTNTASPSNQQMLATTAIPTNAVIEDIIVNSTGSCTVSVGNISGGTQIVNAAAVVSGRQKLTIATPFSSTGNLWVNSSTAATLQFTISYTVAL